MNTKAGGRKNSKTIRERYGGDYWSLMGAEGGKKGKAQGVVKGFAANPEVARRAGRLGGTISRRDKKLTKKEQKDIRDQFYYFQRQSDEQVSRLSQRGQVRPW